MNLPNGDGIEIVQLDPALPMNDDQAGVLQQVEMLGNRLTGNIQSFDQILEAQTVAFEESIEKETALRISERFENLVHGFKIGNRMVACQLKNATIWFPIMQAVDR